MSDKMVFKIIPYIQIQSLGEKVLNPGKNHTTEGFPFYKLFHVESYDVS